MRNVNIVTTALSHGWELIWENPAEPDNEDTWEPGSDSEEPVWGVHVLFDGEHLPLWERSWDGAILRHETKAEREEANQ
jgi:hypothetical protein